MGWHQASYTDATQMSSNQVRVHAAIGMYNRVFQQARMHTKAFSVYPVARRIH